MVESRMIVEGNVQGVGYRVIVKQIARRMKINGKVKNLDDDTVEIYCEADKAAIEKFRDKINIKAKNPEDIFSLNVESIKVYLGGQVGYTSPTEELGIFEIDYGAEAASAFEKSNLERLEIGSLILSSFREESNANFQELDEKYHTVSTELKSINENIAKLSGSIGRIEAVISTFFEKRKRKKHT